MIKAGKNVFIFPEGHTNKTEEIDDFKAGYGLTETANLFFANAETDKYPESMDKIYPGQEYKVVEGELWLKGDNLMQGYYNDPELNACVFEDGWFKTGDLVEFDENG